MLSANAEVPQTAFVAVDHWRGDPSSHVLLLSGPGAPAPLWHRRASALPFHLLRFHLWLCVWLWGWEGEGSKGMWRNRRVLRLRSLIYAHLCARTRRMSLPVLVPQCLCVRCKPGGRAHRSHNMCISTALLAKYQTVSCRCRMQGWTGRCDVQSGLTSY